MALSDTVTGAGKTVAIDNNGGGTYTFTGKGLSGGVYVDGTYTATYTESRITKKWYALSEAAITAYKTANPTAIMSASLVDERTGAWELTVETATGRVITGSTFTPLEA
jgi:hypothetical protein